MDLIKKLFSRGAQPILNRHGNQFKGGRPKHIKKIRLTKKYHTQKDLQRVRFHHEKNRQGNLKIIAAFNAKRPKAFFIQQEILNKMTNWQTFQWIKLGMPTISEKTIEGYQRK